VVSDEPDPDSSAKREAETFDAPPANGAAGWSGSAEDPVVTTGPASEGDLDVAPHDGAEDDGQPTDPDEPADDRLHTALPPKVEAWRRRSATGAILTGFALGLQQAFEKEHEQPAIIMQTSGDPPRDLPVEAEVEHARPRQSVVSIRPWLLANAAPTEDPESGASDSGASDSDADGKPAPGRDSDSEDS
jgi:hypothetical protein